MKKCYLILPALLLSAFSAGLAAAAVPDVPVYDGKELAQDNLSIGAWGGGSAADTTELFLVGGHSLKVTTLDLYQGAIVNFLTPVALSGSGRMFQVTLQRGPVTLHYDPSTVPGAAQTGPQGGFGGQGGRRRGGFGGRSGGFGGRGGGRAGGRGGVPAPLIPLVTKLRLEFTLTDGRKADVLQAIPDTADPVAGTGWYSVNVPLSSLKFAPGAAETLKSVTIAGDQFGVFFIGRMQIAALPPPASIPAAPAPAGNTETGIPQDAAPPGGQTAPGREE